MISSFTFEMGRNIPDTVVVAGKNSDLLALQGIPDVAVEVIIASKEEAT